VAEVTIRRYVRERKRELGRAARATCVPQNYVPGQEGQVDWYEAWTELSGEQVLLQVLSMRSMASGAAFHRAYQRATQQAFLEAHEYVFDFFWRSFWAPQVRQLEKRGEEDPARLSPRGNHALHRVPLALAVYERVLLALMKLTKRAASKARRATSGAITRCQCRRRETSPISTRSYSPPVARMNGARSPDAVSRWRLPPNPVDSSRFRLTYRPRRR